MKVKKTIYTIEFNDIEVNAICRLIDLFRSNKEARKNNPDLIRITIHMLSALSNHSIIAQKSLDNEFQKEIDRILGDDDNDQYKKHEK